MRRSDDTRARVLDALRGGPQAVSGERIAVEIGVSRAAVAKHIAALRDAGYTIEAEAGHGYRLTAAPDAPLADEVWPLLRSRLWTDLRGGGPTGSTNDDCRALAQKGAPEGTVVLASQQASGRGRLGRSWASDRGGVYLSVLLRPALAPADVGTSALALGLGVARGLDTLGAAPSLKWPNDVLLGGRKLAGVLVESFVEGERVVWLVAGVGVNVRRPVRPIRGAAYLDEAVHSPLAAVAAAVLDGMAETWTEFAGRGFEVLREAYEHRHALTGREVEVRDAGGHVTTRGRVAGVDGSGRLVVVSDGETVAVHSGEATLRGTGA